jgi:hypothetical protein
MPSEADIAIALMTVLVEWRPDILHRPPVEMSEDDCDDAVRADGRDARRTSAARNCDLEVHTVVVGIAKQLPGLLAPSRNTQNLQFFNDHKSFRSPVGELLGDGRTFKVLVVHRATRSAHDMPSFGS